MFQKEVGVVTDLSIFFQPYMLKIFATAICVGAVTSFVGVFIVLRGLAFLGDGIAHAAITGVALALIIGVHPIIGAALFSLFFATLVGKLSKLRVVRDDTAVGILFSTSLALGIILFSIVPKFSGELMSVLFGNLLLVQANDTYLIVGVGIFIVVVVFLLLKEFTALVFDEKFALRSGMPVRFLDFMLLGILCLSISVTLKVVGLVLVSSLLVVPPVMALQYGSRMPQVLLLSSLFGASFSVFGVAISYILDTPPGATIALVSGIIFLFSMMVSRIMNLSYSNY